jgi:hypothetical protein
MAKIDYFIDTQAFSEKLGTGQANSVAPTPASNI